jgi:hypothetical protein
MMKRGGCGFVPDDRLLAQKHLLELHNIGFYLWEIRIFWSMSAPSNGKTSFFTASMCSTRTTFAKSDS